MPGIDSARLPRGQLGWSAFVEGLSELDDRDERYFLELKSDVDPGAKPGQAKVAKFILGAANRMPDRAVRRFEGHALLVLGIAAGKVTGVPFFEGYDLGRGVQKFIGADGPKWDFERVRTEGGDVIVVIVDPPRWGDPPWPCLSDGAENLRNGAIYIRKEGETTEAKGDDVRLLCARMQRAGPKADIDVAVVGPALSYACAPDVLDDYVSRERLRLTEAYRVQERRLTGPQAEIARAFAMTSSLFAERPESRTHSRYLAQINDWATRVRDAWPSALESTLAAACPGVLVRARSKTFLEDVEVKVHLEGKIYAIDKICDDNFDPSEALPSPPRAWGPRRGPTFDITRGMYGVNLPTVPTLSGPRFGSISHKNDGSVTLTVRLRDVRPQDPVDSDDDVILVVRDPEISDVAGRWRVTARGHHDVYEGELTVPVEKRDLSEVMRAVLRPEDGNGRREG